MKRKWFVSYMSEVRRPSGFEHWPNSRILDEHPLTWHKSVVESTESSITLIWWKELTEEECAMETQVIDEGGP